jgi:hypothetical protein
MVAAIAGGSYATPQNPVPSRTGAGATLSGMTARRWVWIVVLVVLAGALVFITLPTSMPWYDSAMHPTMP